MIENLFAVALKDILRYGTFLGILDELTTGKVMGSGVNDDPGFFLLLYPSFNRLVFAFRYQASEIGQPIIDLAARYACNLADELEQTSPRVNFQNNSLLLPPCSCQVVTPCSPLSLWDCITAWAPCPASPGSVRAPCSYWLWDVTLPVDSPQLTRTFWRVPLLNCHQITQLAHDSVSSHDSGRNGIILTKWPLGQN